MTRGSGSAPRAERTLTVKESLAAVGDRIGAPSPEALATVFEGWTRIVGEDTSAHVRPERLSEQFLAVVADSPAWGAFVRTRASQILTDLDRHLGGSGPTRLIVRIGR